MKHLKSEALVFVILALHSISGQTVEEKCCPDSDSTYSCYYTSGDWVDVRLPMCSIPIYRLYTRSNPTVATQITPDGPIPGAFDGRLRTIYIIHGWLSSATEDWVIQQKDAYLDKNNFNIITVDWEEGASDLYEDSCSEVRFVGHVTANVMRNLAQQTPWAYQWCTGHSLGAHVCGMAGEDVIKASGGVDTLGRITGMDPAGPFWNEANIQTGLDPTDATLVDNLHTNGDMYGTFRALGDKDYYPADGGSQPGCPDLQLAACSHTRAHEYMTMTIEDPTVFPANASCTDSYDIPDSCGFCTDCGYMGFLADDPGNLGNYTVDMVLPLPLI